MKYLDTNELQSQINHLATANTPFLFLIDFTGSKGLAIELSQLAKHDIYCSMGGVEIGKKPSNSQNTTIPFEVIPMDFELYQKGFDRVMQAINHGDSYLLNLTYPTELKGSINMQAIYRNAKARYKFMLQERFVFYSPEPFIKINNGIIRSFPMKGTISTHTNNAHNKLMNSPKELAEHYTIVDLIRNDLSIVASNIQVDQFRYVESIQTHRGQILQTSSQISGQLPVGWTQKLGDILLALIPAGSVSGAPKERTVEIIRECEMSDRGFYAGVMGVYSDNTVDSCINIRYIEKSKDNHFHYRSGGGITAMSNAEEEYQELLTKIYVPTL